MTSGDAGLPMRTSGSMKAPRSTRPFAPPIDMCSTSAIPAITTNLLMYKNDSGTHCVYPLREIKGDLQPFMLSRVVFIAVLIARSTDGLADHGLIAGHRDMKFHKPVNA